MHSYFSECILEIFSPITVSFSIFHTGKMFPETLTPNTLTLPLKKPPDIQPHSFSLFPLLTSPFFITDQLGLPHLFSILTASSTAWISHGELPADLVEKKLVLKESVRDGQLQMLP